MHCHHDWFWREKKTYFDKLYSNARRIFFVLIIFLSILFFNPESTTNSISKETFGEVETIFENVKTIFGKVKSTCGCGEEVETTFGDENPTFENLV